MWEFIHNSPSLPFNMMLLNVIFGKSYTTVYDTLPLGSGAYIFLVERQIQLNTQK